MGSPDDYDDDDDDREVSATPDAGRQGVFAKP
jgi:hypothetical protein